MLDAKNNTTKKDWNTPPKYIKPIKDFFGGSIALDPCSNEHSGATIKRFSLILLMEEEKNHLYMIG